MLVLPDLHILSEHEEYREPPERAEEETYWVEPEPVSRELSETVGLITYKRSR